MEIILFLIRLIIVIALVVPALMLTVIIWVFGGWTKGFDYMPNPLYALFDWGLYPL